VDPGVLFDEKTCGRKSRETVPLITTLLQTGGSRCKTVFSDLEDSAKRRHQIRIRGWAVRCSQLHNAHVAYLRLGPAQGTTKVGRTAVYYQIMSRGLGTRKRELGQ
jgi:hypothetical protein